MNYNAKLGGSYTPAGIWVPNAGVKSDRSQTGVPPLPRQSYSGILSGAYQASNKFKDLDSYLHAVKTVPWVWACTSVIAYNFANNPYQYLDEDGNEIDDKYDPFLRLWERPNPRQTSFHFKELMAHYLVLAGEAFITLEEWDQNDQPHEMYLPNPARMIVHQDKRTGDVDGYAYDTGNAGHGLVPYEPHEVIHLKYANPLDELRGLGAIEAMETTLNIVAEMTGTELSYWKSGGRITGVLETEQPVDDLTFQKLVSRWREFTSGNKDRARFKTAILEQGLKYQPIAEGLRGIDLVKLEDAKRDEVCANMGVPIQKLAIFNSDTGYKSDDADRFFYGETMEPMFTRVEDGGIQPLVEVFNPDRVFRFARRNYEDDTVKLNNAKIMLALGFTFGEVCEYLQVDVPDDKRRDALFLVPGTIPVTLDQIGQIAADPVQHPMQPPPPPRQPTINNPDGGGRPPGQTPLAGTQPTATNTDNGRSGAVDRAGHLPNPPKVGQNGGQPPTKKYLEADEVQYLDSEEKEFLRYQLEEEIAAARAVTRSHRRPVLPPPSSKVGKGLSALSYQAKAMHSAIGAPRPRAAARALAAGESMQRALGSIRSRLVPKHKAKIAAAFAAQRQQLTPVIRDAITAFKGLKTGDERRAWLRERWPDAPLAEAITSLHREAANDGWRVAKRTLGFGGKGYRAWEGKEQGGQETFVSPVLAARYARLPGRRITGVDDTTIADVEELISEGVRRGYSALQIANGNPDEEFAGVVSIFEDDYRPELIARTEGMFAANWGATTSFLDSGVGQVEAMDSGSDPECAERDGQIFDLDPETGRAVDDDGEPVEDHPNGTLAWAPVVSEQTVETGALDASEEELAASWEYKFGTGQNNNPEGHNQYSDRGGGGGGGEGGGSGGAATATKPGQREDQQHHGAHRRRHAMGGGGGGGGGRGTGAGRGHGGHGGHHGGHTGHGHASHMHGNGVHHAHPGGQDQHAHPPAHGAAVSQHGAESQAQADQHISEALSGGINPGDLNFSSTDSEGNFTDPFTRQLQDYVERETGQSADAEEVRAWIEAGGRPKTADWAEKGDVSGHPFHGNQWTGAAAMRASAGSHDALELGGLDKHYHLDHHRLGSFQGLVNHLESEHGLTHEDVLHHAMRNGLVAYHDADHGSYALGPIGAPNVRITRDVDWEEKYGTGQTNNASGANQVGDHPDARKRKHTHDNGVTHAHVGGARPHTHDKSGALIEEKGDQPGHPFHGNQWTAGTGAGPGNPSMINVSEEVQRRADEIMANLPPDIREHAMQVRATLQKALGDKLDTESKYDTLRGASRVYSPEREALHQKIADQILKEAANVPNDRQAIVMGGLGGSGKTSLLLAGAEGTKGEEHLISTPQGQVTAEELLGVRAEPGGSREQGGQVSNFLSINADDIKERLVNEGAAPNVPGLSPMETSPLLHEESSKIAYDVAERAMAEGKNLIFDVTLGSVSSGTDKIEHLQQHDYDVKLAYVSSTVEHSVDSAMSRYAHGARDYANGIGTGGRFVPPEIQLNAEDPSGQYRSKNEAAFHTIINNPSANLRPDSYVKIDNEGYRRQVVMRG